MEELDPPTAETVEGADAVAAMARESPSSSPASSAAGGQAAAPAPQRRLKKTELADPALQHERHEVRRRAHNMLAELDAQCATLRRLAGEICIGLCSRAEPADAAGAAGASAADADGDGGRSDNGSDGMASEAGPAGQSGARFKKEKYCVPSKLVHAFECIMRMFVYAAVDVGKAARNITATARAPSRRSGADKPCKGDDEDNNAQVNGDEDDNEDHISARPDHDAARDPNCSE